VSATAPRHFSGDEVRRLLTYEALLPAMSAALADYTAGSAVQPVRTTIPIAESGGYLFVMPAFAPGSSALGAKLVSYFPANKGMETHFATIQLFDPKTGAPLVSMDGSLVTEMRTAAVSAVATRALARDSASSLAILGAGVQARSHLDALRKVRDFREIRVWSPRSAEAFARDHKLHLAKRAQACVEGADVVVVATTSRTPVLEGKWIADGTHVNSVGAAIADWRECDDDFVKRAKVFVDSRAGAEVESGDVIAAGRIDAEIGEVLLGRHPGRTSRTEVTWFKSLGMAVEDVVAAELVRRAAMGIS
jgi:ornithine cyclodeaminase/alanine dehydrogenase-like protein (mu-crystallin family)